MTRTYIAGMLSDPWCISPDIHIIRIDFSRSWTSTNRNQPAVSITYTVTGRRYVYKVRSRAHTHTAAMKLAMQQLVVSSRTPYSFAASRNIINTVDMYYHVRVNHYHMWLTHLQDNIPMPERLRL